MFNKTKANTRDDSREQAVPFIWTQLCYCGISPDENNVSRQEASGHLFSHLAPPDSQRLHDLPRRLSLVISRRPSIVKCSHSLQQVRATSAHHNQRDVCMFPVVVTDSYPVRSVISESIISSLMVVLARYLIGLIVIAALVHK